MSGNSRTSQHWIALGGGVAILLAIGFAYWPLLALEHLGWDTYPLIVSSRVLSWGDFWAGFREQLMDGRYPGGHFYRPVLGLSFALDHALWGIRALGYHLSDLLLLMGSTGLLLALSRRLFAGSWGPLVSAVFFALHPLQLEVLPVSARRADALWVLFGLLALWLASRSSSGGARSWIRESGIALAALLAAASKETGFVVPALLFALVFFRSNRPTRAERLRDAVARIWPSLAAVVVFFGIRIWVLGGLGGHEQSSLAGALLGGPLLVVSSLSRILLPQPLDLADGGAIQMGLALLALALLVCVVLASRGEAERRTLAFLAVWLLVVAWLTSISGRAEPWYALPLLPPFALAVGFLLQRCHELFYAGDRLRGAGLALLPALLMASLLLGMVALYPHQQWRALSSWERSFLGKLEAQVEPLTSGQTTVVRGLPLRQPAPGRVGVRGAMGLSDYSVQAYLELTDPERRMWVELGTGAEHVAPREGGVRVVVVPGQPPSI